MNKKKNRLFPLIILAVILCLQAGSGYCAEGFARARVKDISDRRCEKAVIDLLDNARETIVISMYIINPGEVGVNHPVKLLLNDLLEARARGVEVKLYLNTKPFASEKEEKYYEHPAFERLKGKKG